MNELERIKIVDKINDGIKNKEILNFKREELEKLSKHPIILQYLQLIQDIKLIENDLRYYRNVIDGSMNDSLPERIKKEFSCSTFSCDHTIWLYDGSYYLLKDFRHEHDDYCKEYSETNAENKYFNYSFIYNRYVCLECGKKIEIRDWEKFEKTHFVLKNQNKNNPFNVDYYRNFYYQLLYANNIEDSQQLLIEEFNKNKEIEKRKTLNK